MWLLMTAACTSAPQPATEAKPSWGPPDITGNWPVGVRTSSFVGPEDEPITAEVWYPALPDAGAPPATYPDLLWAFEGLAVRDAAPAGTDRPLILFSHGHGGARHQSIFLTEHLASHGFVVAGLDHPHNTFLDLDMDRSPEVAMRRPGQVSALADHVLDELNAGGWLAGSVRDTRVGMLGHSFGAWTSLVIGGGELDMAAAAAACEEGWPGCNIVGGLADTALPVPQPDPRVTATMALSPGGWYSFGDLSGVTPALVVGGQRDEDLPWDSEIAPSYERLGRPRTLATLPRGGHFGFTDACAMFPIADCTGEADGYLDPTRMQELTRTIVTAWAGVELMDEPRYADWLTPEAWEDEPELTLLIED